VKNCRRNVLFGVNFRVGCATDRRPARIACRGDLGRALLSLSRLDGRDQEGRLVRASIVAAEALGQRGLVGQQVLHEPVGQRLVQQLCRDSERAGRALRVHPVGDGVAATHEVGVWLRIPVDRDVRGQGGLVHAGWQQPVVLEITGRAQQGVGDLALVVAHDRLVDLYLVGLRDEVVVWLEGRGVGVGRVAGNTAVCAPRRSR